MLVRPLVTIEVEDDDDLAVYGSRETNLGDDDSSFHVVCSKQHGGDDTEVVVQMDPGTRSFDCIGSELSTETV